MSSHFNRNPSFETLENRLVMSAQALTDFVAQFSTDSVDIDIDQRIETLSTHGGGDGSFDDIESIREQYNLSGKGQTIAIIDSGISYNHEAFGGYGAGHRVVGGYDFAENDANPHEDGPVGLHGTHIAGIIGGDSDSFSGVAPGADLVSLRVFDDNGAGDLSWVEQALQWVHDHRDSFENPITTVNLSIGTDWNSDALPQVAELEDEFAQLEADGIFISVAAGNLFQHYNSTGVAYPAASPFVTPIGSHGSDGQISDFSQRSDDVLFAPGESILSTVPDHVFSDGTSHGYLRSTGTSQSAPFAAGASALLREALERSGIEDIDQDLLYDHFRESADVIFDQATNGYYHRINLERAIQSALADDHGDDYSSSTNLGDLHGGESIRGNIGTVVDRDYFSFTATQNGQITFEIDSDQGFTPQLSTSHQANQNGNQVVFSVLAGNEYRFHVGSGSGVGGYEIRVESILESSTVHLDSNGTLQINGTSGNDQIEFVANNNISVIVNNDTYQFNRNQIQNVVVKGNQGMDTISTTIADDIEVAGLKGKRLNIESAAWSFSATGFENIVLHATGQAELLVVRDSAGDDVITTGIGNVTSSGNGYQSTAEGFRHIVVHASGGQDRIQMVGTNVDDRFVSDNGRQVMKSGDQKVIATDFETVVINAGGGNDLATVRDSLGNDQFVLDGQRFNLQNNRYQLWADGFERTTAESRSGIDQVLIKGSQSNETLVHRTQKTRFSADGFLNVATGFEQITVRSNGGIDKARIYDSSLNDVFRSSGSEHLFENSRQTIESIGFSEISVISENGGFDRAYLKGTSGADHIDASASRTTLETQSGRQFQVRNFDRVDVNTLGGHDTSHLVGSQQRDLLKSFDDELEFESSLQMLRIVNAESHQFDGGAGNDEVILGGFSSLDLLEAVGDQAIAYMNSQQIRAEGIEFLEARSLADHTANYDIAAVDYLFLLDGNWRPSSD